MMRAIKIDSLQFYLRHEAPVSKAPVRCGIRSLVGTQLPICLYLWFGLI